MEPARRGRWAQEDQTKTTRNGDWPLRDCQEVERERANLVESENQADSVWRLETKRLKAGWGVVKNA